MEKISKNISLIAPQRESNWSYEKSDYDKAYPPLGLFSIGTELSTAGYEVNIIDASLYRDYLDRIEESIKKKPLYIGLGAMTMHVPQIIDIAKFIRRISPETLIVLGGIHSTLFPEQSIKSELIDIVVVGNGEYTAVCLANTISTGRDISEVKGLVYKKNGQVQFTVPQDEYDINQLSFPDYKLLDMQEYIKRDFEGLVSLYGKSYRSFPITSGIGCPYKCTFCINTFLHSTNMKTTENILSEIDVLVQDYGVDFIVFRDDIFLLYKDRLKTLLDGLGDRKYNLKWRCSGRANFFKDELAIHKYLKSMSDNGCSRITIGIESGSNKVLKLIKKNLTVEQILMVTKITKNYEKIIPDFSMMIGIPGETREDVLDTVKLAQQLKQIDPKCTISGPTIFRPYPGSELYATCKQYGYQAPDSLEKWGDVVFDTNGFLDMKNLPWIDDPKFIDLIKFHFSTVLLHDFKNISSLIKWLKVISIYRVKFKFWRFPIEIYIFRLLRFIKRSMTN